MEALLLTIQRIFPTILRMSLSASILVLIVIAMRFLFRRMPKWLVCLLWVLVAVRLLCPILPESQMSLMPRTATQESRLQSALDAGLPAVEFETVQDHAVNQASAEDHVQVAHSATPSQYLPFIWIVGVLGMLAYALISFLRLRRLVSASVPLSKGLMACDEVQSPFILGVFRPRIYVPSSLKEPQLSDVLAHEKAHLQRKDHWWKPLGFLLLAVYWFNPLCWLAYILLCRDIEMACDEKVIREMDRERMAAYSQTILDCGLPRRRIAACPLAFGEVGIKARVKGILNYKKPAFWIILAAILACIVLAVCLLTDPFSSERLSDKLSVSMDMAIAEHHRAEEAEGTFSAVDYDVLRVSESANRTTVYAWVMYEVFSFDGTDVKEESGSHIPTAITFDTSSSGSDTSSYPVIEYWEPRDGSYYSDDIRAKFPLGIRAKAFDVSNAERQHENCLRAAREYFELSDTMEYSLNDGRYVISESDDAQIIPYLLINNGKFTIIQDIAVSYQPSGTIERNHNTVSMKSVYASETYLWVFELIDHDQVKLLLDNSIIPGNQGEWKDGMVFTLVQESEAEFDMEKLRAKYPEYFDLGTFKGLELYVWQMAPDSYSCGLMLGTNRDKTLEELMNLKGASIGEIRAILSTYDIAQEDVFIIPWQNPISSYMCGYWVRMEREDDEAYAARQQAYIDGIRQMLFGAEQNGEFDLTDGGVDDPGSVTVDTRADVCALYLEVLEDLWNVDPGLNDGISQIGIDLSELSHLTELEKETVMQEFAAKHHLPFIAGTWEELCEQGYIDQDNLYWEDGLFFSIKTDEDAEWNLPYIKDGDSVPELTAFDAYKWRSGLGAYFFGQCTAQKNADGKWSYSVGQHAIA